MTQARIPTDWNPASWQTRPAAQQPTYKNRAALDSALSRLSQLPPIVTTWEIERLSHDDGVVLRSAHYTLGAPSSRSRDDGACKPICDLCYRSAVSFQGLEPA